ncbi:rhomboid-domain-containing protein [Jackrogersella minutella]|nr:rhomboid-domain-containing protein [Jackrogersella minutella]
MSVLPAFAPPSSFRLGLRAITGNSGKSLISSAARSFSTRHDHIAPCFQYSSRGAVSASRILSKGHPHHISPRISVRKLSRFRVITNYIELPDDYEDAKGLPFRREDLTQSEVNKIFKILSADHANWLLKIMHGRRVAGTLEDPRVQWLTACSFTKENVNIALDYLRRRVPVDEIINAGLRAEDELKYLEKNGEDEDEGEQSGRPNPGIKKAVVLAKHPKPDTYSVYGESVLDRIRAQNIAKREAEEKRQAEEQRRKEEEEQEKYKRMADMGERQISQPHPLLLKWMEDGTSNLTEPPEMPLWERLGPALAMTLLVLGGCYAYAAMYSPPKQSSRLWPDIPPAAATCLGIIGLNFMVWAAWKLPPLWKLFNRYMIVVAATPRPFQLIGAMFSHHSIAHLSMNMVTLYFFGTRLHDEIGRGNFIALYLASGTVGFMGSLANLVMFKGLEYTTLGASGALYGIIAAFFWLHKYDEFKLFGYPPDPMSGPQGLAFLGLIVGLHILPLVSARAQGLDIASHIGGLVAGLAGAELVKKHMDEKARLRAERLQTMGALEKAVQIKTPETPEALDKNPADSEKAPGKTTEKTPPKDVKR